VATSDLKKVFAFSNLSKAWKWIKSNPEPNYKNYFRPIYTAYAAAEDSYLKSLQLRLSRGTYTPTPATKIFVPKPSGILRPITLLNIEDQIVYQAFANLVAERLSQRIKKRYYTEIFGHIYAGSSSNFFYKDWRKGHQKFNSAVKDAITQGYNYRASFDLTACYDSIDHKVINYFLQRLKFSQEFINKLLQYLEAWTAVNQNKPSGHIYLGHGIPQGPLSSGIFSEVVLQIFDGNKRLPKEVKYLRYVDDIRLYAQSEKALRKSLILLDYSSKFVGLFPQSSKIGRSKVKSISEEIKTITYPPEPTYVKPTVDQNTIHKRINLLTQRFVVKDETRFKFTLASAQPRARQSKRLIKILKNFPHLHKSIFNYFSRYKKIPSDICKDLYSILTSEELPYFSLQGDLLRATLGHTSGNYKGLFLKFCEKKWHELKRVRHAEDFRKSLLLWLITENKLIYNNIRKILITNQYDPWLKSRTLFYVSEDPIGLPSYEALLNDIIKLDETDPAIVASYLLLKSGGKVLSPAKQVNHIASAGLKEFGMIRVKNAPKSQIPRCLREITRASLTQFDWRKALKLEHNKIERLFLVNLSYLTTDATGWVMSMDVIMDNILNKLAQHDSSIGQYICGQIGAFIGSSRSRFSRKYPAFYKACKEIHKYRKQADLAHPIDRATGKRTERIKFSVIKNVRPILYHGFQELIREW